MDSTTPPPLTPAGSAVPPPVSVADDKTVAILSYITIIGFIVAIVLNSNKKTRLGAFHLRQVLGLILTSFLLIIPFLNILIAVCLFVFWIMGLIAAIQGQMKPVPLIGAMYQKWFGTAFD